MKENPAFKMMGEVASDFFKGMKIGFKVPVTSKIFNVVSKIKNKNIKRMV